ncbi:MAG: GCN5-related N-acetyltransferase [Herbinix sp.]|nr:GCN5-related N-acetyltransferase [Herbinix sp.]
MDVTIFDLRYEQLDDKRYKAARGILEEDPISGEEFLKTLSEEPELLIGVFIGETLVALAQVEYSTIQSYISVFVAPKFRRKGIGTAVIRHEEDKLRESGTQKILGSFHYDNNESLIFARKFGYQEYFYSTLMQRTGEPFPIETLPVRPYSDNDYLASQALQAKAFHEMRIRVGCFPDSEITQPSTKGREEWKEDEHNRFIYEVNGEIVAYGNLCGNEISSVSVRSDYQGYGIGRKFVMYLCNEIYHRGYEVVDLWCVVGNYARKLYDSLGFEAKYIVEFTRKTL